MWIMWYTFRGWFFFFIVWLTHAYLRTWTFKSDDNSYFCAQTSTLKTISVDSEVTFSGPTVCEDGAVSLVRAGQQRRRSWRPSLADKRPRSRKCSCRRRAPIGWDERSAWSDARPLEDFTSLWPTGVALRRFRLKIQDDSWWILAGNYVFTSDVDFPPSLMQF